MYVYCRQSYNALKPACVFPIEVQLQLEEKPFLREYHDDDTTIDNDDDEKLLIIQDDVEQKEDEGKKQEESKINEQKEDVDLISI